MEEKVVTALKEAKPALEERYYVQISESAFDTVVRGLKHFNAKLVSEEVALEVAVKILDGACKLVLERFRNCAYESEFYEKQQELRCALVDAIELYRDNHPDSQSWLTWVKAERDKASIYMNDFLVRWKVVLESSGFFWTWASQYTDMISLLETSASSLLYGELSTIPSGGLRDIASFLDDIRCQLFLCFKSLLTVEPCHVAEVVSSLTDVPLTQILPSISFLKETAIFKTNQRVVNQEHVVYEIFEIMASPRHMTARPRGLFLLLGSSGTGKTEIAKAVAEHWYCDVSRLVEIDMSEYAEPQLESTFCDLSEWSKRKHEDFCNCLSEVVRKRPYSVILLDKIDKATFSVRSFLLGVLSNDVPHDIEGNSLDFSKSIILMTSSVGANQLSMVCTCFKQDKDLWKQFRCDPMKFHKNHHCSLKGSGCERVLIEARNFFGAELLDSLDKVFVIDFLHNEKAVVRTLLREIVREVPEGRFVVHISDAAVDVILRKAQTTSSKAGKGVKEVLLDDVRPRLSAAEGYNSSVVYVDTLVGTHELSFRFETHERSLADCYFKQKDGTFGEVVENLRTKVQAAYGFFDIRKECLPLLNHSSQDFNQLGQYLLDIHELILRFSPFPGAFDKRVLEEVVPDKLPMAKEKEMFENVRRRLLEIDTGLAKATCIIVDTVVKIIDTPLQSPDFPAKYYLFLCLENDAKMGLINCLTESLKTANGKSFFTYVRLNENCRGEELKKWLILEVKERPFAVFLLDGVEYADDVLYRSLLEIFDKGTLDDGEGFAIDFRRTIVILTSEAANKRVVADLFYCQPYVLHNIAMKQNVKRFRTELLHRVDEIIFFDPILPEHGGIRQLPKRDVRYMKLPDSMLLATFLSKVFDACHYQDGELADILGASAARFGLPGTLTRDVHEVMLA